MSVPTKTMPLRQVQSVQQLLVNDMARNQLASVAAKHMNPERMMRVVANAIRTTPKLSECDPMSLLGALMTCASLGLEPNTPLGHAYLIPFKNNAKKKTEVQLIIGYKGFADLARRSGQIVSLHADVVYDDDELWSYEYGSSMHLRHKPGPRKGTKTHAYCHITLENGQAFIVLPWAQVIAIRDESQGWKTAVKYGSTASTPWGKYEDRMGCKTAVRALANAGEMPLSIEFMNGTDVDGERADFASFAMNPESGGATVDGEIYDAETGEVTEEEAVAAPRQIESRREQPANFDRAAEREPEPRTQKPREERTTASTKAPANATAQNDRPAADAKGQVDMPFEERQQREKPAPEPDTRVHQATLNRFLGDLLEDVPLDILTGSYLPAVKVMRAEAPAVFEKLMAEIEATHPGGSAPFREAK